MKKEHVYFVKKHNFNKILYCQKQKFCFFFIFKKAVLYLGDFICNQFTIVLKNMSNWELVDYSLGMVVKMDLVRTLF